MIDAAVDTYLASVPEPHRALLEHVRMLVHESCPEAREAISYGMPAFELGRKKVLWMAAFKRHCSLYPASGVVQAALGDELTPYLGAKSAIRFSAEHPIPDALVRRVIAARVEEVAG